MQNQNQQNPGQAAAAVPPLQQGQIDAKALQLKMEERELHRVLCSVHRFTIRQYSTLQEEGYGAISDFCSWKQLGLGGRN